jgi:hypothetical protein
MVWCLSHVCHRIAFRNNSNTKVAPRSRKRHVKRCYFATPRDSRPTVEQIVPQAHESHQTRLPSTGPRTATFWSLGDSDWMLAGKGANGNIVGVSTTARCAGQVCMECAQLEGRQLYMLVTHVHAP